MNCDVCESSEHATEQCPDLGLIPETEEVLQSSRARLTLPHSLQAVDFSDQVGVFACQKIPAKTQFGPYEAKKTTHEFNDDALFVLKITTTDGTSVSLDTTSENECNWLCLIRVADKEEEKNCIAYQLGTSIYYSTTKEVDIGSELRVWYAPAYAKRIGKSPIPDGTSRVMLGMKVIYPSVEDLPDVQDFHNTEKNEAPFSMEEKKEEEEEKLFPCKRCNEKFATESKLAIHIRQHILPGYQETMRPLKPKKKRGRPSKFPKPPLELHVVTTNKPEPMEEVLEEESEQIKGQGEADKMKDDIFVPNGGHVVVTGRRVQPRRSLKGRRTTGFIKDSDYVDLAQRTKLDEEGETSTSDSFSTPQEVLAAVSRPSKGRGRPRKQPFNEDAEKEKVEFQIIHIGPDGNQLTFDSNNDLYGASVNLADLNVNKGNQLEESSMNVDTDVMTPNTIQKEVNNVIETLLDKVEDELKPKATDTKSTNTEIEERNDEDDDEEEEHNLLKTIVGKTGKTDTLEIEILKFDGDAEAKLKEILDENSQAILVNTESESGKKTRRRRQKNLDLREHEKEIHEGGKLWFVCGFCNKRFTHRRYLRMHLPGHTDMYRCNNCGMKYVRPENLNKHQCKGKPEDKDRTDTSESADSAEKDVSDGNIEPSKKHVCDICSQNFDSEQYLFRHMALHTDLFKCDACGKTFSRKDSLQRHVLKCCPIMAEQYGINYCSKCWKTFATVLGRDNHSVNCTKAYCSECHKVFNSEETLATHECSGDSNQSTRHHYTCDKCNKSFLNLSYFEVHKTVHEAGEHDCALCSKKLPSKEKKEEHEKICFAFSVIKRLGSVTCDDCGEEFSCIKKFREHTLRHNKPYQCEQCGKSFVKIGSLYNHVCLDAGEEGLQRCEICSKMFQSLMQLYRHKSEAHGQVRLDCEACKCKFESQEQFLDHACEAQPETGSEDSKKENKSQKFMCHVCGKCLVSKSNLNSHMKLHGEKNFVCPICDKRFHCLDYLKIHIAGFHEKKFRFVCPKCGKILTSKPGLTNHMKIFHATVRNVYPCPKCGKQFTQKGNMKTHLYSHTSEKNFVCPFCSKQFKYPDQLNRHKLTHTMLNKLQCEQCDKEFVKSYELRKHQALVHSGMMYVCEFCGARCGHKHTVMRHYKRKHPAHAHLVQDSSYINKLFQRVYDDSKNNIITDKDDEDSDSNGITINGSHFVKMDVLSVQEGEMAVVDPQVVETLQGISTGTEDGITNDQAALAGNGAIIVNQDGTFTVPSEAAYSLQTVQHVIDGKDGEKKTVLILQLVNTSGEDDLQQIQIHQLGDEYVQEETMQVVSQGGANGEVISCGLSEQHDANMNSNVSIVHQSVGNISTVETSQTGEIQMIEDVVYSSVGNDEGQVVSQQEAVQVLSLGELNSDSFVGEIKNTEAVTLDAGQMSESEPQQIIVAYDDTLSNVDQFVSVSEIIKDS